VFRDAEMYEEFAAARRPGGDPAATRGGGAGSGGAGSGGIPASGDGPVLAPDMPSHDVGRRSGWVQLGLAVVALAGLVIGAATTGIGTKGILDTYRLSGTLFGATIATAVLTIEDIFLTVEPFRKGVPEIGVGNVIGSVVFCVTGKLGITLLAGRIVVTSDVLTWHLPALIVMTGLGAYFISTGRLLRWHGYALLALYVIYWAVSFGVFGGAPVDN